MAGTEQGKAANLDQRNHTLHSVWDLPKAKEEEEEDSFYIVHSPYLTSVKAQVHSGPPEIYNIKTYKDSHNQFIVSLPFYKTHFLKVEKNFFDTLKYCDV